MNQNAKVEIGEQDEICIELSFEIDDDFAMSYFVDFPINDELNELDDGIANVVKSILDVNGRNIQSELA